MGVFMATLASGDCGNRARPRVVPGSWRAWAAALRLPSLLIAISPVLVGTALAYRELGVLDAWIVLQVALIAVLVQVATNLQNDVGYTVRGGERSGTRTGLPRATAEGWLTVRQVRVAIGAAVAVAVVLGLPLLAAYGWPVLAIGVSSILAALAYMGGPRPIAYSPYGEATVFVFFGLVAVGGTNYVLGGDLSAVTWLAAVALGGLAAAALVVNNHRDIAHDSEVGRRTFAVNFGARASARLYGLCLLAPFGLLLPAAWAAGSWWLLVPLVLLPSALALQRDFLACGPGLAFSPVLYRTFQMELKFAALLAVGLVAARLAG